MDLYIIHRFDYGTPIEETMETLHGLVKAGKVRALGASAMYAYQFYTMQIALAQQNGWTQFVSMQNHYNLLYREEEREMIPLCKQQHVALTPYSPLAAGRVSRTEWKTDTMRSQTDKAAKSKYDGTQETDYAIVLRVSELAQKYGATMTQIALAWHFAKGITAPIIGATQTTIYPGCGRSDGNTADRGRRGVSGRAVYAPQGRRGAEPGRKALKILIAYYSHSGNTRRAASLIQRETGGDLYEIVERDAYPREYGVVVKQAKQEIRSGYQPPLQGKLPDISQYDTVFIGSPNWWSTIAPPVATWLSALDFTGRSELSPSSRTAGAA